MNLKSIFTKSGVQGYQSPVHNLDTPAFNQVFDNLQIDVKTDSTYHTFEVTVCHVKVWPAHVEETILAQFKAVAATSMRDAVKDASDEVYYKLIYSLLQGAPSQLNRVGSNVEHSEKYPYVVTVNPGADFGLCFFTLESRDLNPPKVTCIPTYYQRDGFLGYQGRVITNDTPDQTIRLLPHCLIFNTSGVEYIFQFKHLISWEDLCGIVTCTPKQELGVVRSIVRDTCMARPDRYPADPYPPPSINRRKELHLSEVGMKANLAGPIRILTDDEGTFLFNVSNCTFDTLLAKCTGLLYQLGVTELTLKVQNKLLQMVQDDSNLGSSKMLLKLVSLIHHLKELNTHIRALKLPS